MVRGLVYSLIAVSLFLLAGAGWLALRSVDADTLVLWGGWLLLVCLFAVGPLFFALGYWHHRRLHPREPHWDRELGE